MFVPVCTTVTKIYMYTDTHLTVKISTWTTLVLVMGWLLDARRDPRQLQGWSEGPIPILHTSPNREFCKWHLKRRGRQIPTLQCLHRPCGCEREEQNVTNLCKNKDFKWWQSCLCSFNLVVIYVLKSFLLKMFLRCCLLTLASHWKVLHLQNFFTFYQLMYNN